MELPIIQEFENLLKSFNIRYKNHKSTFLTAPGENYGSVILKVEVICEENKKLNLVVKLCPKNELLKKAFLTNITFKKEIYAYEGLIPALKEFENEYNIQAPLKIFAKCYGTRMNLNNNDEIDEDAIIILENLKTDGYQLEDRFTGFNKNQSTMIIKNMAQLHATVIAMKLLKVEAFKERIMPALETINSGSTMVEGFIDAALHSARIIKDLEPYFEKLEAYLTARKKLRGLQFPSETNKDFYTIVHTDLWSNNILIRRIEETMDMKIIDLQLLDYGSPLRDLLFFIFTSVQIDLIERFLNDFICIYFKSFKRSLLTFGCSLNDYSEEKFYEELNNVAPHELFHIIFMLKPIFSEKGSIESLDNISVNDFGRTDNIGKTYLDRLTTAVSVFAKNKWL